MENVFSLSPMNQTITLEPSVNFTGHITITNPADSKNDFPYLVSISPYDFYDENSLLNADNISAFSQIVDWITIPEPTGTIAPNESRDIEFIINVPENAPVGGQYAIIMVSQNPEEQESNGISIGSVFSLTSIIYANIKGEASHDAIILENNIPNFSLNTPVTVSGLLENHGNVHEKAIFTIDVTNNITGEKIFSEDNQDSYLKEFIMPENTRLISRQIDNLPILGSVKIKQVIYYGNDASIVIKDVIICPIWFMILITLILFGATILTIKSIKHHRRKKTAI